MKKAATWTVLALATSLAGCTGAAYTNRSLDRFTSRSSATPSIN